MWPYMSSENRAESGDAGDTRSMSEVQSAADFEKRYDPKAVVTAGEMDGLAVFPLYLRWITYLLFQKSLPAEIYLPGTGRQIRGLQIVGIPCCTGLVSAKIIDPGGLAC